jgi:hypothetical protein
MDLKWLIFPATFIVIYAAYCRIMRTHTKLAWEEILSLRLRSTRRPMD